MNRCETDKIFKRKWRLNDLKYSGIEPIKKPCGSGKNISNVAGNSDKIRLCEDVKIILREIYGIRYPEIK